MNPTANKPAALGVLLASSRQAAARYAGAAIDREQWRRVVGARIAARTEPGAKRGRELTVNVASASWAQELSLLVTEIVVRLKAAGIAVDTIRFRVKEIAALARDPAAMKPVYRKAALPDPLRTQLEGIDDLELREAIGEAAALWLALDERASTRAAATTSATPSARSPRDVELRNARSVHRSPPGHAGSKGRP